MSLLDSFERLGSLPKEKTVSERNDTKAVITYDHLLKFSQDISGEFSKFEKSIVDSLVKYQHPPDMHIARHALCPGTGTMTSHPHLCLLLIILPDVRHGLKLLENKRTMTKKKFLAD